MDRHTPLVKQAAGHFTQGDYAAAHRLYLKAAEQYGEHLFRANIQICEKRLKIARPAANQARSGPVKTSVDSHGTQTDPIAAQLAETQKLLEHYYTRCQELEYRLLDQAKAN